MEPGYAGVEINVDLKAGQFKFIANDNINIALVIILVMRFSRRMERISILARAIP
jgi:hypothetical protein